MARYLTTYRVEPSSPTPLSPQELRRLVTAVDLNGRNGLRDFALLQVFLQCGLRVGEVVRLSLDDVIIHKTTGKLRIHNEKGRQERTIPLNRTVHLAVQSYLDTRGPGPGADPVFVSERRQRLCIASVQYLIKKYLRLAGRGDLSVRDLRRHFAQAFYHRSGSLPATQQVLGHRDINTTARYTRASDQDIEAAINALDNPV